MKKNLMSKFIYLFLFASGAAGLIYEVVWTRLLLLALGSTITSVVVVTVTFMAGLAAGSYVFGKRADRTKNILQLYSFLELGIGLAALVTPFLANQAMVLYQNLYWLISSDQFLLLIKIFVSGLVFVIPAFLMGGTVPVAVRFFRGNFSETLGKDLGKVYAVNTAGAVAGTLLAAYVLIEIFGLSQTVYLAVMVNLLIGTILFIYSRQVKIGARAEVKGQTLAVKLPPKTRWVFLAVAVSGFCGMAYEIVWTRLLTPIVGTYIYAFAFILAILLSGIAVGGFLYQKFLARDFRVGLQLGLIEVAIGLMALMSLFILSSFYTTTVLIVEFLVIFPAAVFMGMSFPVAANLLREKRGSGEFSGRLYTINTIGSLLGPIAAAFIFIPMFGSGQAILALAAINVSIGLILLYTSGQQANKLLRLSVTAIVAVLVVAVAGAKFLRPNFFYPKTLKYQMRALEQEGIPYQYLEDPTASVLAYMSKDGRKHDLLIDGVGITNLVTETKLMAHLPLLIHPNANRLLAICFGMGTTFRSAMTYDINVDAVELVPSVAKVFPMFFNDGSQLASNPKGRIIINDGRNYVFLTKEKYDVITVDPPPPVNSAGTTVLYSQQFYSQAKRILNPNGIFAQWVFDASRPEDIRMIAKSFALEFPYVRMFNSPSRIGYFLLGSSQPIEINEAAMEAKLEASPKALADLNEWQPTDIKSLVGLYYGDKGALEKFVGNAMPVTDDHPRTEYFLLRHTFSSGQ